MSNRRIPTATYRLQFNRELRFNNARELVPYLHTLGITDLYASPLLQARRGSPHGYDVTVPGRLNPELGGTQPFQMLAETLKEYNMGLVLDIVPNHMAAGSENPWWRDVLRFGQASLYASFFDIDWQPARPGLSGKILLPVLGAPYGRTLENGELKLIVAEDGLWVTCRGERYPLGPASTCMILTQWSGSLSKDPENSQTAGAHPGDLAGTLKSLPPAQNPEFREAFRQVWDLFRRIYSNSPGVKAFIEDQLRILSGRKGDPASFERLDRLLGAQAYRLASWRAAGDEINYRRFFDITGLVSLRVEEELVFEAVHALIFQLIEAGRVTGLRIDHIDGLHDPQTYLCRLQERLPGAERLFYVVVEKILGEDEKLPPGWPVYGTTGYDFLNQLNGLFIDGEGAWCLDRFYVEFSGNTEAFKEIAYTQKKRALTELFAGEMNALTRRLGYLAEEDRHGCDLTLAGLARTLVEVTACLPVYRTYIRDLTVPERDRQIIEGAVQEAGRRLPAAIPAADFLRRVLLLQFPDNLPAGRRQNWLDFVMRWQQYTGPAMAKGYEDTALYVYNRLVSLNEVGGNPAGTGISVAEFHHRNRSRRERWPHTLNATSTPDTKRGEDVRARVNVLSEIPGAWSQLLKRWSRWNRPKKPLLDGLPAPGGDMEMLIYQTLVGAWPLQAEENPSFKERLKSYVVKAAREAKLRTGWLDPNAAYEGALEEFVAAILEPSDNNLFLRDFLEFQKTIARFGALNALAQVLLKIASPGVPDFYQGTELWTFTLVDPDNRRPLDFGRRAALLAALQKEEAGGRPALVEKLLNSWKDGRVKLYLTYKALNHRRSRQELFEAGEYIPVDAVGTRREHVCAFARRLEDGWVLAAVPRLVARLYAAGQEAGPGTAPPAGGLLPAAKLWGNTALVLPEQAPDRWQNILTDEEISVPANPTALPSGLKTLPLAHLFSSFPVALLAPSHPLSE